MPSMITGADGQYSTSEKLAARARLHGKYAISETAWFPWIARHLALAPGDSVLDLGCGPGWFWNETASQTPSDLDLTLADISPNMVVEALQRAKALPFRTVIGLEADAVALPLADNSIDKVMALHMLYHVSDQPAALREIHRILKPGGTLAVTTNGAGNMREIYGLTTIFGGSPTEPVAAQFGFDQARALLKAQFGNVTELPYPVEMRVTSPSDVFLAMTSFPPGDTAAPDQLDAFRGAIDDAFAAADGELKVSRETSLFLSTKTA